MSSIRQKKPSSARRNIKQEMFSSFVSQARLYRLQDLLSKRSTDHAVTQPEALLCIAGIDARYNEGCTQLLNYLLFGFFALRREELEGSGYEAEVIDDVMVLVAVDCVHVYCNPINYHYLLPYIAHWRNLHIHCLKEKDYEDEEKAEEFKIASLVAMVTNHQSIAIPYFCSGHQQKFDKMQVEKWPIIQAYALEGIGGGSFFTLKHEVSDISAELAKVYDDIDPVVLEALLTEHLPLLERQWDSVLTNLDVAGLEGMLSIPEKAASEPLRTYFKHGQTRGSLGQGSSSRSPFVLYGVNTNWKNLQSAQQGTPATMCTPETSGVCGKQALHMVCQAVSPRRSISCTRTYFLGLPYTPQTAPLDIGIFPDEAKIASDCRLLMELYLACVDAVLIAMDTYGATLDVKLCQKAALKKLIEHSRRAGKEDVQAAIADKKCIKFSLQAYDSHNRSVAVDAREAYHPSRVMTLSISIADIVSVEQPGQKLGSVCFSETFLLSTLHVRHPDGSVMLDMDYVVFTANIPRIIVWPASPADVRCFHGIEKCLQTDSLAGFHQRLLEGVECHLLGSETVEPLSRGHAWFYREGLVYVHKHMGAILLPRQHMTQLQFSDGDSPSQVALLVMTLKPAVQGHLPPSLQSAGRQLGLAFFPKTRAYREFFSKVMSVWREDCDLVQLQLTEELPEPWQPVHERMQQEYLSVSKPSTTPLKRSESRLHGLHSFLRHFHASSCLRSAAVPANDVTAVMGHATDVGSFHDNPQLVVTVILGVPGCHQAHMCDTLTRFTKDAHRWQLLQVPLLAPKWFNLEQTAADLVHILEARQANVRPILLSPGYNDPVDVIGGLLNHPSLASRLKIGAVTVCVDPQNFLMCDSYVLPKLLEQCAQGWVNNVVFTNGVNPQTPALSSAQSLIRAVNSDVALLLADKGEVTRTPDVELILSETAFENQELVRARHLSCPGWYDGTFSAGPPSPLFTDVTITFRRPLEKTRLLSKLKGRCVGLRPLHKPHPFTGNVYTLEGIISLAESSKRYELQYSVLSRHLSLVACPHIQNGHGGDNMPYRIMFTGCQLQESCLKAWLMDCAQQVPEKKLLRTRQSVTKTELKTIHREHHLEPLPEGWFYNGSQYVSMNGDKCSMHPNIDEFVEKYLQKQNAAVQAHNHSIDQQCHAPMFKE